MAIEFLDGPVAGQTLDPRRAPIFLRVVIDQAGTVDCLDQLHDEPRNGETIHVYRAEGSTGVVFACTRSGRGGGQYGTGSYRHLPDAPVDELRDTAAWRAWVQAQPD